jgi:hypothetical protein
LGCEEEEEGKAGRGEEGDGDYNCDCYLELELWSGTKYASDCPRPHFPSHAFPKNPHDESWLRAQAYQHLCITLRPIVASMRAPRPRGRRQGCSDFFSFQSAGLGRMRRSSRFTPSYIH